MNDTQIRHEGPTPSGGVYAIAYFRSSDGTPTTPERAAQAEIVEFSASGTEIRRSALERAAGDRQIASAMSRTSANQLFRRTAGVHTPPAVHRVPHMPVVVDGRRYEPSQIARFNGRPLHFLFDREAYTEGVLRAFRRMEDLWQYLSEQRRSRTSASGQEGVALVNPGDPAYFYEHVNYAGAQLSVSVGHALSDLRKVSFFPWWWINWNDQISSLKPAPPLVFTPDSSDDPLTVMYEHIDFDGSSLAFSYIPGDISSLVPYGWNDRVSSIAIVAPSS